MAGKKFGGDFFKSPGRIIGASLTGGLSETGLFDPSVTGADHEAEQIKKNMMEYAGKQKAAINEFEKYATPEAVQKQIGTENAALEGNLADIRRKVQQNIARQGLQNSSLGQAAMVQPERQIGQQISLNNISGDKRMMDLAQQRAQMAGQALAGQNVPLNFQSTSTPSMLTQLLPALLSAGGAIGGAALGGPMGATAGGATGSGLGKLATSGSMPTNSYNTPATQGRFRF